MRARDLLLVLAVAAVGALGALPGSAGRPDPLAWLAWIALCSAAAGFYCGAAGVRLGPLALVPPAVWMGVLGLVDGASPRDLPSPGWAALAWTGLFAAGFGIGRAFPDRRHGGAGALLLLAASLAALPIGAGLLAEPLSPAVVTHLLDASPATLLAECAGVDWMRHPAVYAAAGTADIDPALRVAYRGALAGPIAFVVGCALAAAGEAIARARSKP